MRVDLAALDPTSPLAQRITAALARDCRSISRHMPSASNLTTEGDHAPWGGDGTTKHVAPLSEARRALSGHSSAVVREEDLHRAVVAMITVEALPGVIAVHVPNGGKRNRVEAAKLKGMGTLAGVPDLIVLVGGKAYGLEIKTEMGRLSAAQKQMAERFRRAGCEYEVARSVVEARLALQRWKAIA